MENINYKPIQVDGSPTLIMRYYEAKIPQKGILIFVHGVSHGAWCWEKFVNFFTEIGYACFAVNLRGHGDDKANKKGFLRQYVDDVSRCIDFCKIYCGIHKIPYSKPSLLGHSMGGGIVELYMNDHSKQIKNAILFAPATAQGMGASAFSTTASKTGLYTAPTILGKANKYLSKSNFFIAKTDSKIFTPRITDKKELEFYDEHLCSENIFAMLGLISFKLNKPNIPVFVIGSDKDAFFPAASLNRTADFYNTKPMILKGLCHDMMLDPEWSKAAQSVLEFIENPEVLKDKPIEFIDTLEKKIYPEQSK